jgi:8-oxo-dGTP diphosphatase
VSVYVDGILIKKGKILLLKRNVEPFKGYWHVVGGHVEEDETLKDAIKREYKEETNLEIETGDMAHTRIEETFDRVKFIIAFEVINAKGEIKLNEENTDYGWFDCLPEKSVFDYLKIAKMLNTNQHVKKRN